MILPWWWRWAALGLAMLAAAAFGAVKMHEHDRVAYEKLHGQFEVFKDRTAALGIQAKKDAQAKAASDRKLKEESDAQNSAALATLAGTIKRLRESRAGGGFLPAAPAGSPSPDRATFDRAELERAIRALDQGVQGLVDEGSATAVKLDTAKRWALSLKMAPVLGGK